MSSDPAEHQHPLVAEIEWTTRAGRAASDHDRRQDRLLELVGLDLGVEVLFLLMERDEPIVLLGVLLHFPRTVSLMRLGA